MIPLNSYLEKYLQYFYKLHVLIHHVIQGFNHTTSSCFNQQIKRAVWIKISYESGENASLKHGEFPMNVSWRGIISKFMINRVMHSP